MFPKPTKSAKKGKGKGKGKRPHSLKSRSSILAERDLIYRRYIRPAYLAGLAAGQGRRGLAPLCERCMRRGIKKSRKSGKEKLVTEVHHVGGREGLRLIDPLNLAGTCWNCHREIEAHPREAEADGWVSSRAIARDKHQQNIQRVLEEAEMAAVPPPASPEGSSTPGHHEDESEAYDSGKKALL